MGTPVKRRSMPLITRDGAVRPMLSARPTRRPLATSLPASTAATSFGISSGGFWRSPSIVTTMSPRARLSPACIAGCWPALRRKRTPRTRASAACCRSTSAHVPSDEPSSTRMSSHDRPAPSSVSATRRCSSATVWASSKRVTTTETAGSPGASSASASPATTLISAMADQRYNVPSSEALSGIPPAATLTGHVSPPADRIEELRRDRSHGGSWLARHAVETLVQEAAAPATDAEELLGHLAAVARDLAAARPEMGSVAAATGRLVAAATRSWALSASELRRLVLDEARALLDGRDRAARAIAVLLGPRLEDSVVLTHSASATVHEAVLRTPPARLLCTTCNPDGEGGTFAEELRQAGIAVEIVDDAEAPRAARGVRLVLVGADTIYRDGTLLNRRGTLAIAEAAAGSRVPVVVAAESIKLAPFPAP